MNTERAYNEWASQYDSNLNKTRDLEGIALRECLKDISFDKCLEIGCGTGKNTVWLVERAHQVTCVDLSEEMLAKAKGKINSSKAGFVQADINKNWSFVEGLYDLVSFSLVLEHIENLDHIFKQASALLNVGGCLYVGELHPFKQYSGSKARFETDTGTRVADCFNHHISDFTQAAKKYGLQITNVNEYFDNDDHHQVPRILTLLFIKKNDNS